jgi:hypothetical protein
VFQAALHADGKECRPGDVQPLWHHARSRVLWYQRTLASQLPLLITTFQKHQSTSGASQQQGHVPLSCSVAAVLAVIPPTPATLQQHAASLAALLPALLGDLTLLWSQLASQATHWPASHVRQLVSDGLQGSLRFLMWLLREGDAAAKTAIEQSIEQLLPQLTAAVALQVWVCLLMIMC